MATVHRRLPELLLAFAVCSAVSVGLFLLRLAAKGSRVAFEQQIRVNAEVWLPRRVQAFASARLGLLGLIVAPLDGKSVKISKIEMSGKAKAKKS